MVPRVTGSRGPQGYEDEDHLLSDVSRMSRQPTKWNNDELEPGFQGERRKQRYRMAALCLVMLGIATACSIAAYRIAWSSWAASPEWQSYERENLLLPQERYKPIEEHVLYIGIMSAPTNFEQRNLARQKWVDAARNLPRVKIEFLVGQVPIQGDQVGFVVGQAVATVEERNLEMQLQREADFHKDISRIPVVESLLFETDKVIWVLENAVAWRARFVMKTNEAEKVEVEVALEALQKRSPIAPPSYFGKVKLWPEEGDGMRCTNYFNLDRIVASQQECQDKCGEQCVGISYSHKIVSATNCYVCNDDTLETGKHDFAFFRKPIDATHKGDDVGGSFFGKQCYGISGDLAQKISVSHFNHTIDFPRYGASKDDVGMAKWIQFEEGIRRRNDLLPVKRIWLPSLCSSFVHLEDTEMSSDK